MWIDFTSTDVQPSRHQATDLLNNLPEFVYGLLRINLLLSLAFDDQRTIVFYGDHINFIFGLGVVLDDLGIERVLAWLEKTCHLEKDVFLRPAPRKKIRAIVIREDQFTPARCPPQ